MHGALSVTNVEEFREGDDEYSQIMALYDSRTKQFDTSVVPLFLRERYLMQRCGSDSFWLREREHAEWATVNYYMDLPVRWK